MAFPTATIVKTSTAGTMTLGRWIWRNKFLIIFLFAILPTIILSFHVAKETHNPYYPFIKFGTSILDADSVLYEDVQTLQTNPAQIIGMEKPEIGLYQKMKYKFKVGLVVWALLGLLSLITLPFFFFYWVFDKFNTSTKVNTFFKAFATFFLFILIVNLLIIVYKQGSGSVLYTFDPSLNFFGQAGQIIGWVVPLHGVWALGKYLIALI